MTEQRNATAELILNHPTGETRLTVAPLGVAARYILDCCRWNRAAQVAGLVTPEEIRKTDSDPETVAVAVWLAAWRHHPLLPLDAVRECVTTANVAEIRKSLAGVLAV